MRTRVATFVAALVVVLPAAVLFSCPRTKSPDLTGHVAIAESEPPSATPLPRGWAVYRDTLQGFDVAYPPASERWAFLTPSEGQAPLTYKPVSEPFSLLTKGRSEEGTRIFVSVYQKPADSPSMEEWLQTGYSQGRHYPEYSVPRALADRSGDISTALSRAHDGRRGLLSYQHTVRGTVQLYEVGIVDSPGQLLYSTYFTRNGKSIFVLTILLPIYSPHAPHDPDSLFVTSYARMVESFKFRR
jgi:hypothetical protein